MELSDFRWSKRDLARNPLVRVRVGHRVTVPRTARKVYLPRRNHYAQKGYTEDEDANRLEQFYDDLQPCVVKKSIFGWRPHQCRFHEMVVIQETK